jgi:hypothetical protein
MNIRICLESLDDPNIYRLPLACVLGGNITMVVIHNWFAYKLTIIWPKNCLLEHPKYLLLPNNVQFIFQNPRIISQTIL